MAGPSLKLKTLYLMKILLEKTDESHVMSAAALSVALDAYGISADRRTIYGDIEILKTFGLDIIQQKGTNAGYYVGRREFELPELKLLVDAVQSSKFITSKKSRELIQKLESLASENDAKQLQRDVFIYNRIKTGNETIYYSVDKIHTAIMNNKQIKFHYGEWTIQKKLKFKRNGEYYQVSPWALTWDDENYYLIAYDKNANQIRHYRVDKMQDMELVLKNRVGEQCFEDFDLATFAKKTFSMYGGYDELVTLFCHNSLAGVVLDRFGQEVRLIPVDEEYFKVKVLVSVSRHFFGWVTGVGNKMLIDGPEQVKKEYKEYMLELIGHY